MAQARERRAGQAAIDEGIGLSESTIHRAEQAFILPRHTTRLLVPGLTLVTGPAPVSDPTDVESTDE